MKITLTTYFSASALYSCSLKKCVFMVNQLVVNIRLVHHANWIRWLQTAMRTKVCAALAATIVRIHTYSYSNIQSRNIFSFSYVIKFLRFYLYGQIWGSVEKRRE